MPLGPNVPQSHEPCMSFQQPTQYLVGNNALSNTLVCLIYNCELDTILSLQFLRPHRGRRDLEGDRYSGFYTFHCKASTYHFLSCLFIPSDFCSMDPTPMHLSGSDMSQITNGGAGVDMNVRVCPWPVGSSATTVLGKEEMRIQAQNSRSFPLLLSCCVLYSGRKGSLRYYQKTCFSVFSLTLWRAPCLHHPFCLASPLPTGLTVDRGRGSSLKLLFTSALHAQ